MVTLAEAALLLSVVDSAVRDTVLPAGTPFGAVKVVGAPLAVCAGENEPQGARAALLQIGTQSTPALATSSLTVAATIVVMPKDRGEGGGACVIDTEIVGV